MKNFVVNSLTWKKIARGSSEFISEVSQVSKKYLYVRALWREGDSSTALHWRGIHPSGTPLGLSPVKKATTNVVASGHNELTGYSVC